MKITIDTTDDNKIELVKVPIAHIDTDEPKPNKNKRRACRVHYSVDNEELLYKLADAGLLQKMHGVNFIGSKNIWFFTKDEDVKVVIDKFNEENTTAENSAVKDIETE